jgi:DeoR/GlpR family transcriptional regulator of sugar metabolism
MPSELVRRPQAARRRALLPLIERDGFVSVVELANRFRVSEMTIRRDLKALERGGVLQRTHGGAVGAEERPLGAEPPFVERQKLNADAKQRIARMAARLVRPQETIGIDVGTTTLDLARMLLQSRGLRVFTNSLRVAMLLADSSVTVYALGGEVRPLEMSLTGNIALAHLQNYRLDRVFIGVSGINPDGIFDYSIEDSEVKQVFIRQAKEVIVLADSSKFGKSSTVKITDLSKVTTIVTERAPDSQIRDAIEAAGTRLLIASEKNSDTSL